MIINSNNKRTFQICLFVLIAIIFLGIGYAVISNISLLINSTRAVVSVNKENFKVHFIEAKSITGTSGVGGTSIIEEDDTVASFSITGFSKVGDYAIAKYIIRNDSNDIGAKISLNLSNSNSEYFNVVETIEDDELQAGDETVATVRIELIKTPITNIELTSVTSKIKARPIDNSLATGNNSTSANLVSNPVSFSTDSWETIQKAVQDNNTSMYNIGDTKTVTIGDKDYTVRLANKSSYDWCFDESYSQTSCGFVVEFADIITNKIMYASDPKYPHGHNEGGYPGSIAYGYIKDSLFYQLPDDLQSVIINTRVISGHGYWDPENHITIDKLYLLSGKEITGVANYDSAASLTTQLDYYKNMGVVDTTNASVAIKKYQDSNHYWWLRTADATASFQIIFTSGIVAGSSPSGNNGISPAFRIG